MSKQFGFAWLAAVVGQGELEQVHQRRAGMVETLHLVRHF
jgi:hypothetical protein